MKPTAQTIYLDSHATTPVDPEVLSEMLPYFTEHFGNGNHKAGWKTNAALENARCQVSNLVGARPSEIIFTSGATEAINMALLGVTNSNSTDRNHIVTQKTEHKAVLETVKVLESKGYKISMLDVDHQGKIDLNELKKVLTEKTLLVAIMLVNNEVGTIQPIQQIGGLTKSVGAYMFCDLTQALGWYPIDVEKMHIDMAAMSAHKLYGPRGIGALYLKSGKPGVKIKPILNGGGQERGLRPGTQNIPAIVGFGKTCEMLQNDGDKTSQKIQELRDRMLSRLESSIDGVRLNGCRHDRHPGNLNLAIPEIAGEELKELLHEVVFSTSSACSSTSSLPSHVLTALKVDDEILKSSFRLGISKYNTPEEIDYVAKRIIEIANKKKASSQSLSLRKSY